MGLRACTYSVEIRNDPEVGLEKVFMEPPAGGSNWRVVELRPVSEGISHSLSHFKVLLYLLYLRQNLQILRHP